MGVRPSPWRLSAAKAAAFWATDWSPVLTDWQRAVASGVGTAGVLDHFEQFVDARLCELTGSSGPSP